MGKVLWITMGLLLVLPLAALAGEATVKSVDMEAGTIVLDDGTTLALGQAHTLDLKEGDKVEASYEVVEGTQELILHRRVEVLPPEADRPQQTTNFGTSIPTAFDMQAGGDE